MKDRRKQPYTVVSLFSGALGFDLGVELTGRFQLLACVENDAACVATAEANKARKNLPSSLKIVPQDIRAVDAAELMPSLGLKPGELDLLIGGPPCQSFSTAGRRGTVQDPRGTLIWEFLRFVEVFRPKYFVMENVRGLLSAALRHRPLAKRPDKGGPPLEQDERPGSVVRLFAQDLQKLPDSSYHLDIFEVNAVNYGAPQIRERVLFFGNRFGRQVDFPEPTHGEPNGGSRLYPWRTLGEAIAGSNEREPLVLDFSPRKKRYLQMVPPGSNWRSLPPDVQRESMGRAFHAKGGRSGWWRRLSLDLPCPTLVTMPNHASTSLCHPTETRALSLREYARIQEFPDNWEFCGTILEQYAQVGNAVPVRLGQIAGETIARQLDGDDQSHTRGAQTGLFEAAGSNGYRIVYLQSHVRTRKWFKKGKVFVRSTANPADTTYGGSRTLRTERAL